jgi:hypothetical protein
VLEYCPSKTGCSFIIVISDSKIPNHSSLSLFPVISDLLIVCFGLKKSKTPAVETLSNLETILASGTFTHLKPGNFQYVDLRFGSKVFVNEAPVASSTPETTDTEILEESVLVQDDTEPTLEEDVPVVMTVSTEPTEVEPEPDTAIEE